MFQYPLLTKLIKVGLSTSRKVCVICLIKGPLKMIENVFLFHLKSSLGSQDIKLFVTTFWSCRKKGLIRKIRSTSKLMTCHRNLVYKRLQYKYCPTSHKVKVTRQWDLNVYCNCLYCMAKKWRQNLKYLENEKSFWGEIKNIFRHF